VQPAGGVDDDHVEPEMPGLLHRAGGPRHGIQFTLRVVHPHARLLPDDVQLLDGGRPFDVGRDEQRMASLPGQPFRQLAGGCRLAGALQAQQQHDPGTLARRLEAPFSNAEERDHLVADDPDDLLRRREAAQNILPHRAITNPVDERLDDLEIDVRLEQREPNLAQRSLDVLFGEPRFAAKGLEDVLEACTERVEHDR
jgi:hypothetical protein